MKSKKVSILALAAALLLAPAGGFAIDKDNTGINERDRDNRAVLPTDQSESASDLTISQSIRQSLQDDKSLSTNAKNVKIITQDGVVTLRGPVANPQEKSAIEKAARQAPGVRDVRNMLDVTSNQ